MQAEQQNLYLPYTAEIIEIIEENFQIKTFVLAFVDRQLNDSFSYEPGQFLMLSVPHCGEAPISISSTPAQPGSLHLSIRAAGKLTTAMHQLVPGDTVGLRGPYGRPFPMDDLDGHDLLFVAGGIFGFLPVLGFWMVPVGLVLIALDVPPLRRWLRSWLHHGIRPRRRWLGRKQIGHRKDEK